jgi:hypothetical protein
VLHIFITLKNLSPRPGLNPRSLGPVVSKADITHTDLYLSVWSHYHLVNKHYVLSTLAHTTKVICDQQRLHVELDIFKCAFRPVFLKLLSAAVCQVSVVIHASFRKKNHYKTCIRQLTNEKVHPCVCHKTTFVSSSSAGRR